MRNRKNNFRSFIYSHGSTVPAYSAKIGPVDVEIIGLTETVKISDIKKKTPAFYEPTFGRRSTQHDLRHANEL